MTDKEFLRIKELLKKKYGIDMSHKKTIVEGRLENYVRNGQWDSYSSYISDLERDASGNLEKKLVDILTTNHTYFMRETEHFDFLKRVVLPELKEREKSTKDLHIWCAASSSGEEPYTLAMILKDFFGFEHSKWDTQILATDVSDAILRQAIKGEYTVEQVEPLPDSWRRRYFRAVAGTDLYRVTDELKREVLYRKFNLMDPLPFKKPLDVVFIRNVMIYFDDKTKKELLHRIYNVMKPGAYMFLGRTETLDRNEIPFKMIQPSIFMK